MNINKQYLWRIIKQYIQRHRNPTKGDKRFEIVAWITLGCYVLFIFAFVATGSTLLAWLMYGAFAASMAVVVAGMSWRLWDIITQVKANGPEVHPTTRLQVVLPPSGFSGVEQMRVIGKVFRWQYGLAAVFLISSVLVPVSELKIGLPCLMELSFLWAIQRIWSYRPASEREGLTRFTTLKLSFTLISAGFMLSGLYFILGQLILVTSSELTISAIYLALPLVCGFPPFIVGFMLLIRVVRTDGSTALQHEEHQ